MCGWVGWDERKSASGTMLGAPSVLKTPSQMDVAPWDDYWIKMVLHGIAWYLMVFVGTRWNHMVLNVTVCIFMILPILLDDIGCYRM